MFFWQNPSASLRANQPRRRVLERLGPDDWNVYAQYQEGPTTSREKLGAVRRFSATQWVAYTERGDIIEAPPPARAGYFPSRAAAARAVWDRALHGAYSSNERERYWYFAQLNQFGGTYNRFGPYRTKSDAERARERMRRLYPERVLDRVRSSFERFPSNLPRL